MDGIEAELGESKERGLHQVVGHNTRLLFTKFSFL